MAAKKLSILIIGFGSIGERHFRNLKKLGYKPAVYDVDHSKMQNAKCKMQNLGMGSLKNFDVVVICSPNHLHVKHALLAARAGCHLFIEKPLSHNLRGITKLQKMAKRKKLVNMVACNTRFHPALQFVKKYLKHGRLGKVYSIAHEFGYYLPYWRKGQDYRKNYAARRQTGGGIHLDDIHEFDLMYWLNGFVPVKKQHLILAKESNLKIETPDMAAGIFQFRNGVLGIVKSDYLQKQYTRRCQVVGEKGTLEWDFESNVVWLRTEDGSRRVFQEKGYDVNQMYVEELKYFLACVKHGQQTSNDIATAASVLKLVLLK